MFVSVFCSIILVLTSSIVECSYRDDIETEGVVGYVEKYARKLEKTSRKKENILTKIMSDSSVDFFILESNPKVEKIIFRGRQFKCNNPKWKKFIEKAVSKNVVLFAQNTSCSDVDSESEIDNFLHFIIDVNTKEYCPMKCRCKRTSPGQFVTMDCGNTELGDSDLPKTLPFMTDVLRFDKNKLKDVSSWLYDIVFKLSFLCEINLEKNMIQELPRIPTNSPNPIKLLYFSGNQITKMDVIALKSYVAYEDSTFEIHDNPLLCDCDTEEFLEFLRQHPWHVNKLDSLSCLDGEKQMRPWIYENPNCTYTRSGWYLTKIFDVINKYWGIAVLFLINIILLWIFIDIMLALKDIRNLSKREFRSPIIHGVVVKIQVRLTNLWNFLKSLSSDDYENCP